MINLQLRVVVILVDKNILVQYCDIQEEVKDLRRRIRKLEDEISHLTVVSDSVTGTREDGTIGHIKITGYPFPEESRKQVLLRRRKAALEEKEDELLELLSDVEEYINSIDDSRIRRIFRYRYVDNMSWVQVAVQMGGKHTADSCRMAHDRYIEEK